MTIKTTGAHWKSNAQYFLERCIAEVIANEEKPDLHKVTEYLNKMDQDYSYARSVLGELLSDGAGSKYMLTSVLSLAKMAVKSVADNDEYSNHSLAKCA